VLGAWRALRERGLTAPIVAVQAERCAPIAEAFTAGASEPRSVENRGTAAAGVAIAAPVRGAEILRAVRATGGRVVTVSEGEIEQAVGALQAVGLDVEPTAAVPTAALSQLAGDVVLPVASGDAYGRSSSHVGA
jgi:threonine synthase